MVLSKRERIIAIVTLVVVGALIADRFVLTPILNRLDQLETQKQDLLAELNEAQNLFERRRLLERKWKTMLSEGLRNDQEAESRVARALDDWSEDARLTLTSVKPEHAAGSNGMKEITFVIAGRGGLDAVAWFLYQIETAEMPVKVKDMQLGSTSEAGDNMSLQLRLSAIYAGEEQKSSEKSSRPEPSEANDEQQLL